MDDDIVGVAGVFSGRATHPHAGRRISKGHLTKKERNAGKHSPGVHGWLRMVDDDADDIRKSDHPHSEWIPRGEGGVSVCAPRVLSLRCPWNAREEVSAKCSPRGRGGCREEPEERGVAPGGGGEAEAEKAEEEKSSRREGKGRARKTFPPRCRGELCRVRGGCSLPLRIPPMMRGSAANHGRLRSPW